MSERITDPAAQALAIPQSYADEKTLHEKLTHLRHNAPVSWVETEGYAPFWAITKHADVLEIERQHDLFTNWPRPVLTLKERDAKAQADVEAGVGLRTLIHSDGKHHRDLRKVGAEFFRPRAMRKLKDRCDELAKIYVDQMLEKGPELDFAQEIAVNYPLYVILTLLGMPESDFPRMLKLTQELFGGSDSEFQRDSDPAAVQQVVLDFFNYFGALTAHKRENPSDDLGSVIANATIDGEPMSDMDTLSYYVIVATAGHDTTSAAIGGGLHALVENQDELTRLQNDPGLTETAVEEMIRWVTPVKEFMRTAQVDTEIRGVPIAKGEAVLLSYVSANRDEDVFEDPFRFDIGREPNRQLSFGFGVHFCLGAALARMEISSFYNELIPRLKSIELAGEPSYMATTFVGGPKHLPVRYELR